MYDSIYFAAGSPLKMSSYHQDASFFLLREHFILKGLWSTDLGV